ncbi:YlaH-like family protein [Virgibacillus doumboii]|uniref:YlaH-like family protein n=1 Tax=Virgibacillus doumboii TaxID=2697503 RepID=UPI0013DEAFDB|nr:YlaH-like family protein [Virgibacillus doumboii]
MNTNFSLLYDFLVENFHGHELAIFYVLNLIFAAIAYKLGFARQLPILKSVLVYIMLAFGSIIITFFSVVGYPITESLIIMSIVLGIYRFRLHQERKKKKES